MIQTTVSQGAKAEVKRLMAIATTLGSPDKYAGKRKKSRLRGGLWMEARFSLDSTKTVQVSTHDISLDGISIWLRKKIDVGDFVYLRDNSDSKSHPWISIKVTHCVIGLKGFLVGGVLECDK